MHVGSIRKMRSELNNPVDYFLPVGEKEIYLNSYLGNTLKLKFNGSINCLNCGRKTNKSFSQGYCFPCMKKLARCDLCMMKPETCHYFAGSCREPEWAKQNCFVPHDVYLANTSALKVGITRHSQIPTRWIDQGATQATIMFQVATRQQSGFVEMAFKDLIADKTNWRTMLKGIAQPRDLLAEAEKLKQQLQQAIAAVKTKFESGCIEAIEAAQRKLVNIEFPVLQYPAKIVSHNFDKNPIVEGTLLGIKGQYLIFDTGVINIRKFSAYNISVF